MDHWVEDFLLEVSCWAWEYCMKPLRSRSEEGLWILRARICTESCEEALNNRQTVDLIDLQ